MSNPSRSLSLTTLLARVKRHVTRLDTPPMGPLHGPGHWRRVEKFGRDLASYTGADLTVVCLFAWFHDAYRHDDGDDPDHGQRAAEAVVALQGNLFHLTAEALEKLRYACAYHADGQVIDDATIGTCWDADRLDLGRVGIMPAPEFMSTEAAKRFALMNQISA
jgi:uncharacterized protein